MQTVARLRWAILMLCAFVSAAGAQVTGPVTTRQTFIEVQANNVSGDLLSGFAIAQNRPDTLRPGRIVGTVVDTLANYGDVIMDFTFAYGNEGNGFYRDTVRLANEIHVPAKSNASTMPDSLVTLTFTQAATTNGDRFEIVFVATSPDQGYTTTGLFADDSVHGTAADTSFPIYIGRGAADVSFGFSPYNDTTAATYTVMFNSGFGWGMSSPVDTLADSLFTWGSITSLRYIDAGELLAAPWAKLIRRGTRPADTTTVKEFIRVEPR